MGYQILYPGKNNKNISKFRLLTILPRMLSVNQYYQNELFEKASEAIVAISGKRKF